jgi:hypothetical protein
VKIVITGHTSGLGKGLYDHFLNQGHEVFGLSRSNGFDISDNFEQVVDICSECDLFINNAYCGNSQSKLLLALKNKVKKIVVCGSSVSKYRDIIDTEYSKNKKDLSDLCGLISLHESSPDILYLDISFIKNNDEEKEFNYSNISTDEIVRVVEFWLENPKVSEVKFSVRLTQHTYDKIKIKSTNNYALDQLMSKVNHIYEKY